jgi:DNA-binding HxlR family transcriptional regulator
MKNKVTPTRRRRAAHDAAGLCPRFHHAVELIGRRWTGAIVSVLLPGARRFNELLVAIPGISDRLLSERLRELESEGVVRRIVMAGPPVRVEYVLSKSGRELEPTLKELGSWAERWVPLPS